MDGSLRTAVPIERHVVGRGMRQACRNIIAQVARRRRQRYLPDVHRTYVSSSAVYPPLRSAVIQPRIESTLRLYIVPDTCKRHETKRLRETGERARSREGPLLTDVPGYKIMGAHTLEEINHRGRFGVHHCRA